MNKISKIGMIALAILSLTFSVRAESSLNSIEINQKINTTYKIAGTQFLPEVTNSELGFSAGSSKGNYNKGGIVKKGCTEGSTSKCVSPQILTRTYRAPNGKVCYVCSNGTAQDCLRLGFKLKEIGRAHV